MAKAKNGDNVKVHYTGKVKDGTVFDSSRERGPLQFTIGESGLMPDFEMGVIGMEPGETKTVEVPAEKAYGPYREEMVLELEKEDFPVDVKDEIGQKLEIPQADGRKTLYTITAVSETSVTLDANHPLAGKDIIFEIELLGIT